MATHIEMRMEPVWWQYMQSKLPITLGRAFLATFFADLRLPMLPRPRSPSAPPDSLFLTSLQQRLHEPWTCHVTVHTVLP